MGFDTFLRKCFSKYGAVYSDDSHVIFIPLEHSGGILYDLCQVFQRHCRMQTPSYVVGDLVGFDAVTEIMFLDFPKSGRLGDLGFGLQSFSDMCKMLDFEARKGIFSKNAASEGSMLYSLYAGIVKRQNG